MTTTEPVDIFDMSAKEYLRDLAERLMRVPVMYGTDQGDVDRLLSIAKAIEKIGIPIEIDEDL